MSENLEKQGRDGDKATVTLPATVEKVIPAIHPSAPDKVQISVEGAEELYKEIRVENVLADGDGNAVALKEGAEVEVTIAADPEATTPQKESPRPSQHGKDKKNN